MTALVTGASSGIGLAVCKELASRGYDVVGTAREEGGFSSLRGEFPSRRFRFLSCDLSSLEEVKKLLEETEGMEVDFFFDNAGFGVYGPVGEDTLDEEMAMVDVNVKATHFLLKSFLNRMEKKGGHALVTSSAAAFAPSPRMSAYHASKAYVYFLSLGYRRELEEKKSKVVLSVLCPGPVSTSFQQRAGVRFSFRPISSSRCASYAVKKALKGKVVIIPSLRVKALHFFSHLFPKKFITRFLRKSSSPF